MRPEDLRVGNYYMSTKFGVPVRCEVADFVEIYKLADGATPDHADVLSIFQPLIATEMWLIDFGFEISHGNEYWKHFKLKGGWYISMWISDDKPAGFEEKGMLFWGDDFIPAKYVHDIQDLYRSTSGNELKLTTNQSL